MVLHTLDRNTIFTIDSHYILKCLRMTNRCFFTINIIFNLANRIFISSMFSLYRTYFFCRWTFPITLFFSPFAWLFIYFRCCFRFTWNWNLLKTSASSHYHLMKKKLYSLLCVSEKPILAINNMKIWILVFNVNNSLWLDKSVL